MTKEHEFNVLAHIREFHLLWMPSGESLAVLGDSARLFDNADGDLLLAPSGAFSDRKLVAAFEASGEHVWGYVFDYPCSVSIEEAGVGEWCAYPTRGVGYAVSRDVAEAVCAASFSRMNNIIVGRIRPTELLLMPDAVSLAALGDAVGLYGDNGSDPDGNLWLAPKGAFNCAALDAALAAGGELIVGYEFEYPCGVAINRHLPGIIKPGEVKVYNWCGYSSRGIGYALSHDVAIFVCAASILAAQKDKNG